MGKFGSMAPAVASAVLFSFAELAGASKARTAQLLTVAVLLAALAALHTHAVLGKGLRGWRLIQPFHGGTCFVILQAGGWTCLGVVGAAALHVLRCSVQARGFTSTLGIAQLVAQIVLVISLTHFENVSVGARLWKWQVGLWIREGIPLTIVVVHLALVMVACIGMVTVAPPSRNIVGWALASLSFASQAAGLRMMWTLTWNLGAVCAYLLESEEALAVMACMGVGSICAPWYIGRMLFQQYNLPKRAMIGLSTWGSDEALIPFGLPGWYMHEVCLSWIHVAFCQLDIALHLVPAALLLQHCAWTIRPIHVLYSGLLTILWGHSLSLHYVVLDWKLLWEGRLAFRRWGRCSMYEPDKVAYIYQFENDKGPQDEAFTKCCPGFLLIILVSNMFMALLASFPWAGEFFFMLGGGYLASVQSIGVVIGCLLVGGVSVGIGGLVKVMARRSAACNCPPQKVE